MKDDDDATLLTHTGGCHCGAVRWEIEAPAVLKTHTCNCSICNLTHYQHLIVPKHQFRVVKGDDHLNLYTFGSGIAQHYFCKTCGTSLATQTPKRPGSIVIKVDTLDDPSVFTPGAAIFTCDKQAFHHIPDGIPAFDKRPG